MSLKAAYCDDQVSCWRSPKRVMRIEVVALSPCCSEDLRKRREAFLRRLQEQDEPPAKQPKVEAEDVSDETEPSDEDHSEVNCDDQVVPPSVIVHDQPNLNRATPTPDPTELIVPEAVAPLESTSSPEPTHVPSSVLETVESELFVPEENESTPSLEATCSSKAPARSVTLNLTLNLSKFLDVPL